MRIVIAGGSGLIGRALAQALVDRGAEVVVVSRAPRRVSGLPAEVSRVAWDGRTAQGWGEAVDGARALINLAGASIAGGRWTVAQKRRIVESRRDAASACVAALRQVPRRPELYVQASAVGYYGSRGDEELAENAAPGEGFLAATTVAWESAAAEVEALGVRRVLARTGVVLAREGGALPRMLPPFRFGLGGPLGSGRQWMPWIHLADEVGALIWIVEHPALAGPINLVAPVPATNRELSRALARALGRPCLFRVPAVLLRLLLGEMAELLLGSQRVVPRRLLGAAYPFRYPALDGALADLVR